MVEGIEFLLLKLKLEHINLTCYSRMHVDLAPQVFQCTQAAFSSLNNQIADQTGRQNIQVSLVAGSTK